MTSAIRPRTRRARRLRHEASDAERLLWRALREANLPVKLRRQHPIGCYIADFAMPARKRRSERDLRPRKAARMLKPSVRTPNRHRWTSRTCTGERENPR